MGQWVSLWESNVYPVVQWDGTDRWDSSMDYGIVGQSVESQVYPLVPWDRTDRWDSSMDCGTVGQNVESPVFPLVQWDRTYYGTVGQSVGIQCVPTGTMGWDGQVG